MENTKVPEEFPHLSDNSDSTPENANLEIDEETENL